MFVRQFGFYCTCVNFICGYIGYSFFLLTKRQQCNRKIFQNMPKTQSFLWNMAATNAHLTVKNNLIM